MSLIKKGMTSLQECKHPYLIGILLLTVMMILTYCFLPVYFETNDAGRMMFQMAGYFSGELERVTNFIGLPLCTMIVSLYELLPSLPWFSLVLCSFFVGGCYVCGISLIRILKKHHQSIYTMILMLIAMYGIAFIYPMTHMHIYYACAIMGLSVAMMVIAIDIEKDTWKHYLLYAIVALIHLFICFNLGFSASICVVGFVGIAVLYQCLKWLSIDWKKMLVFGFLSACIAGVGLGTYLVSTNMKGETMSDYQAYNKYRLSFTDYPHVSYDEDPQRYENVGWSKAFYRLADTNHYLIDEKFNIGDITVDPFRISHDARQPSGYRMECGGKAAAVATDLGMYDDYIVNKLTGLDAILLEANHDVHMLEVGGYPYPLKRRILGEKGHLSNELSGMLLCDILHDNLKHIVLGHLSKENNYARLAYETVKLEVTLGDNPYKGEELNMRVANRDSVSDILSF